MGECEKCGFLECRCPDHVAQNYVRKADLRKLAEELRAVGDELGDNWWMLYDLADKVEALTGVSRSNSGTTTWHL